MRFHAAVMFNTATLTRPNKHGRIKINDSSVYSQHIWSKQLSAHSASHQQADTNCYYYCYFQCPFLSVSTAIFPGEPELASFIEA